MVESAASVKRMQYLPKGKVTNGTEPCVAAGARPTNRSYAGGIFRSAIYSIINSPVQCPHLEALVLVVSGNEADRIRAGLDKWRGQRMRINFP